MLNTTYKGRRLLTLDLTDTLFSFRAPSGYVYLNHAITHLRLNSAKRLDIYDNSGSVGGRGVNTNGLKNKKKKYAKEQDFYWLGYLSSKKFEERIQKSFIGAYTKATQMWPSFGFHHNITSQQWWMMVILNTFHQLNMIVVDPLINANDNNSFLVILDSSQLQSIKLIVPGSASSIIKRRLEPSASFAAICSDIFKEFSCKDGYRLFSDVIPFLTSIKSNRKTSSSASTSTSISSSSSSSSSSLFPMNRNSPITIGCISNATSEYREQVLPGLGLKNYIDFTLLSEDIGVEKPNPIIFKKALQIAQGISPPNVTTTNTNTNSIKKPSSAEWNVIHVGDDLEKDVFGALQMGWTACWMVRTNTNTNNTNTTTTTTTATNALLPSRNHLKQKLLEIGNEYWKTHHRDYRMVKEDQWNHILQQNVHIVHDFKMIQDLGLL